jgi:hypothetical protein
MTEVINKLSPADFHTYQQSLENLGLDKKTARKSAARLRLHQIQKSSTYGKFVLEFGAKHSRSSVQDITDGINLCIKTGVESCAAGFRQNLERGAGLIESPIEITVFEKS